MVPGLDKLKKDYAEIDKKKNTNMPINPVIITNPDDINTSYLNYPSNERGKRSDTFPFSHAHTYNEKLCKISRRNIITTLQNFKTREDVVSYLQDTLRYNPIVKNIDVSYETFPPDTSDVRASVSIEFVDNTNICCDLSLLYD